MRFDGAGGQFEEKAIGAAKSALLRERNFNSKTAVLSSALALRLIRV
jgi:hypothetical protein